MCNLSEVLSKKQHYKDRIEFAEVMLKEGEKFEKIKKYTRLSEELLTKIASSLGVAIVL